MPMSATAPAPTINWADLPDECDWDVLPFSPVNSDTPDSGFLGADELRIGSPDPTSEEVHAEPKKLSRVQRKNRSKRQKKAAARQIIQAAALGYIARKTTQKERANYVETRKQAKTMRKRQNKQKLPTSEPIVTTPTPTVAVTPTPTVASTPSNPIGWIVKHSKKLKLKQAHRTFTGNSARTACPEYRAAPQCAGCQLPSCAFCIDFPKL